MKREPNPPNPDFVPPWMADLGLKAGPDGWLNMSKAQLRSQQRPDKPLKVQVWATGMLHAPGYGGQEATTMRNKKRVPLTPGDIIQELWTEAKKYYAGAGIKASDKEWSALKETKEHLRRALMELEEDGVALRTDAKGTALRDLSADQLCRLPSGRTRIFFWLVPRAADPETVAAEWRERQENSTDPEADLLSEDNREVAKPWLPPPPIWQILKVFQIEVANKAQLSDPTYQKVIEEARLAARETFLEVVNGWLPQEAPDVAAQMPPEVATTGGALESKDERRLVLPPTDQPSSSGEHGHSKKPSSSSALGSRKRDDDAPKTQRPKTTEELAPIFEALKPVEVTEVLAVKKLFALCREEAPDCTPEEVALWSRRKIALKAGQRVRTWVGYLQTSVPPMFAAPGFALWRAEQQPQATEPAAISPDTLRDYLEASAAAVPFPEISGELRNLAADPQMLEDLESLEDRLTVLEERTLALAESSMGPADQAAVADAAKAQLKQHRAKMTKDQLATLEKQHRARLVLEKTGIPRLSLYYMRVAKGASGD